MDTQDLIQRYLYLFGAWEPHLTGWLRRRLRPGDGFVDVGANIGVFSVLAARLVGESGRVVAIEASADVHRRLVGTPGSTASGTSARSTPPSRTAPGP